MAVRLCVREHLVNGIERSEIQVSGEADHHLTGPLLGVPSKFAMVTSGMGWADGSFAPLWVHGILRR